MGLAIGIILGFLGLSILIIPFIIDLYVSRRQTDLENPNDYKRALEAAGGLIAIATVFLIGGLIIVGLASGAEVAKAGLGGAESGFLGEGSGGEGTRQSNQNAQLVSALLPLLSRGRGE